MNKAILVIDMPDKCSTCPCFEFGVDNYCSVTGEANYSHDNRKPDWCPLKPLQEAEKSEIEALTKEQIHTILSNFAAIVSNEQPSQARYEKIVLLQDLDRTFKEVN